MAVALVSSSTSGATDTNSATVTTPVPAGTAAGHIALLGIELWGGGAVITWPAGFTEIATATSGSQTLKVAWKRLTAADTGNYVATLSAVQWQLGHCLLISGGLASGDPIEASNTAVATSTAVPSTSVTTATQPFLAHMVATEQAVTSLPPTSYTEAQDATTLHTNYLIPAATGSHTAAGGTVSASSVIVAALVAVMPAITGISLVTQDATHAQTAENVVLGTAGSLAVQDAASAQTAPQVTLTQAHVLVTQDAAQAHTVASPTVSLATLAVQDATQAQTAALLALVQVHVLAVGAAAQAQASDNVVLGIPLKTDITVTVGLTRLATAIGPTRGAEARADATRAGVTAADTRAGTVAGPTRRDRGA